MQLYPTRAAAHIAIASVAMVGVGLIAREPAVVGWGGAMLVAIALARAVTLVSVARIRAAGFEMLWTGPKRVIRAPRGGVLELEAEVRNRDTLAARYVKLRAVASSQLHVTIDPPQGEVSASGRLRVIVKVRTPRVGHHGLHGLALEVHGAPGMFEVPLTFANPYGIEVLPRPFTTYLMQARGGRSRLMAASGRPGPSRGEGSDLRELREHQPGDPFRRIAWKASARRGTLLVRDFEREERDVVWLVLDASVDLWAGPVGRAPLDYAIDEASAIATRHLSRGDRVGLYVFAQGPRVVLAPDQGPVHAQKLAHALLSATGTYDASRSDLDEGDVALRVMEHLRPLDARGLADVRRGDLDKLAARADAMRSRAPVAAPPPGGKTARERMLRRYLASYGIESPPKTESDRKEAATSLIDALTQIGKTKPRPSLIHVIAASPEEALLARLSDAVRRLLRRGAVVTWSLPQVEPGLLPPWDDPLKKPYEEQDPPLFSSGPSAWEQMAPLVSEAVLVRASVAHERREKALRKLGVRVMKLKPSRQPSSLANDAGPAEPALPASGVATSDRVGGAAPSPPTASPDGQE
jgi:uncharacterized protein (DUF58 family)